MQTSRTVSVALMLFVVVLCCATASARVIYVDGDANGLNNGSSWVDAYYYLQDALMMAQGQTSFAWPRGCISPTSSS